MKKNVETDICVAPCIDCGSADIALTDCKMSSFNYGGGTCNKCGREIARLCSASPSKDELARIWNAENDIQTLILAEEAKITAAQKRIADLGNCSQTHTEMTQGLDQTSDEPPPAPPVNQVLLEVAAERQRQDQKWGGPSADDVMSASDWYDLVSDYNGWARRMLEMKSPDKARRRYVQLAAIAVTAVEQIDRANKPVDSWASSACVKSRGFKMTAKQLRLSQLLGIRQQAINVPLTEAEMRSHAKLHRFLSIALWSPACLTIGAIINTTGIEIVVPLMVASLLCLAAFYTESEWIFPDSVVDTSKIPDDRYYLALKELANTHPEVRQHLVAIAAQGRDILFADWLFIRDWVEAKTHQIRIERRDAEYNAAKQSLLCEIDFENKGNKK